MSARNGLYAFSRPRFKVRLDLRQRSRHEGSDAGSRDEHLLRKGTEDEARVRELSGPGLLLPVHHGPRDRAAPCDRDLVRA